MIENWNNLRRRARSNFAARSATYWTGLCTFSYSWRRPIGHKSNWSFSICLSHSSANTTDNSFLHAMASCATQLANSPHTDLNYVIIDGGRPHRLSTFQTMFVINKIILDFMHAFSNHRSSKTINVPTRIVE